MNVALVDIRKPGDNKDFSGGFGTTFKIGRSAKSRLLALARSKLEKIPTMSYAYMSAIFKKYGNSVKYYENQIPEEFDFALMHVSLIRHKEEIEAIKELKKFGKVGVYGPLASVMPKRFKETDFIVVGEPEAAIIKIAQSKKIPKGKIRSAPIMNLDKLPFPDWSIFPMQEYSLSPAIDLKPIAYVYASRGCTYSCSYCPYLIFGKYRARKPEKVIQELEYLKKEYGVKAFFFRDPTFSINRERIKKLAGMMIQKKLNLMWGCETRLDLLDKEILELLYKSGLRAIKVGVESVNHALLKKNGRIPPKIEHQEEIIKFCKKIGVKVIAFYIIGIPGDTRESIEQAIRYSQKLNTSFANFTICTPIPGTKFYETIKDKLTAAELNDYDHFHPVFQHDNLNKEEILELHEKAITGYYFRPRYISRYLLDKIKAKLE